MRHLVTALSATALAVALANSAIAGSPSKSTPKFSASWGAPEGSVDVSSCRANGCSSSGGIITLPPCGGGDTACPSSGGTTAIASWTNASGVEKVEFSFFAKGCSGGEAGYTCDSQAWAGTTFIVPWSPPTVPSRVSSGSVGMDFGWQDLCFFWSPPASNPWAVSVNAYSFTAVFSDRKGRVIGSATSPTQILDTWCTPLSSSA